MRSLAPTHAEPGSLAVELSLLLLTLSAAFSASSLFTTHEFMFDLAFCAVLAHGLAAALRRWQTGGLVATVIMTIAGTLTITNLLYGTATTAFLPSSAVARQIGIDLNEAVEPLKHSVAPVQPFPGFVLALCVVIWFLASFSDSATFRGFAPIQAVLPTVATVFGAALLRPAPASTASSLPFVASLGSVGLALRFREYRKESWVPNHRRRGLEWLGVTGSVLMALSLIAAILLAPPLQRLGRDSTVDLRRLGSEDAARIVDNPLVSVASLLGPQSQREVMRVEAEAPHYFRLSALEDFDGTEWSSNSNYRPFDGSESLEIGVRPDAPSQEVSAKITIVDLESSFVPVLFPPNRVRSSVPMSYDKESGAIITDELQRLTPGTRIQVTSELPSISEQRASSLSEEFPNKTMGLPASRAADLTSLPGGFSPAVKRLAQQITAEETNTFRKLRALQDYFRNGFIYDISVNYGASPQPMEAFIQERRGFCQQFATTFAAMARSMGLASRVAVGFIAEERTGPDAPWILRGKDAHAWPEVYLPGLGWLSFEPTPSRGNPDSASYTGAFAEQQGEIPPQPTTTPSTTSLPPSSTAPSPTTTASATATNSVAATASEGARGLIQLGLMVAVIAVCLLAIALRKRHVRSSRRGNDNDPPEVHVARHYRSALVDLKAAGHAVPASSTPLEAARLLSDSPLGAHFSPIALAESNRRYSPEAVLEPDALATEQHLAELHDQVLEGLSAPQRFLVGIGIGLND